MKPAPFAYERPPDVAGALALLGDAGPETAILAGGQSLVPALARRQRRPALIIDINAIASLDAIRVDPDGTLVIGALARLEAVRTHPAVRAGWPLIAEALAFVANPVVRHRGTLVGNLVNNAPGCEMAAVALALDAIFVVERLGHDPTAVPAASLLTPASAAPTGLVTAVRFPPQQDRRGAFLELARRPQHVCVLGAAIQRRATGITVALAGFRRPVRCHHTEAAIADLIHRGAKPTADRLRSAVAADCPEAPRDAFSAYRVDAAPILVADAFERSEAA